MSDQVIPDPLGLRLRLGPDQAAKGEPSARHSPASLSTGECGGNGSPGQGPGAPAAVDIEARVRPRENALRPFGTQQLPASQEPEDLPAEDLRQPRVVDPGDLMEVPRTHDPFPDHEYRRNAAASTPPSVTRKWRCT